MTVQPLTYNLLSTPNFDLGQAAPNQTQPTGGGGLSQNQLYAILMELIKPQAQPGLQDFASVLPQMRRDLNPQTYFQDSQVPGFQWNDPRGAFYSHRDAVDPTAVAASHGMDATNQWALRSGKAGNGVSVPMLRDLLRPRDQQNFVVAPDTSGYSEFANRNTLIRR